MDTVIAEKRNWFKKNALWIGLGLLLLLGFYLMVNLNSSQILKVEEGRLRFAEVRRTDFVERVSLQGTLAPEKSFFLDAVEGGTVQEIYLEAGQNLRAGDPILRLSNTNVMLDFMSRETQIVEQINNLRNTRLQIELSERQMQEQLLDLSFDEATSLRQFKIDTVLFKDSLIASQAFHNSWERIKYLGQKKALVKASYETNKKHRAQQIEAIDQSITMMERNLAAIKTNLENLVVKAPIGGQLSSLLPEIGESVNRGENIGRIDVINSYIVKAQVDEHYLRLVHSGQEAFYNQGGKTWHLMVEKVYPEVLNNQFQVDFSYQDSLPENIRTGQGVNLRLALGESKKAIVVPRGAFFGSTGGRWVFILSPDGKEASRREVKFGRQNPEYIEVLEGLEEGDRIVSNNYDDYDNYEILKIEK